MKVFSLSYVDEACVYSYYYDSIYGVVYIYGLF